MQIYLDDPSFIPEALALDLTKERPILESVTDIEMLTERDPFRSLAIRLDQFIRQHEVRSYHCTKEPTQGYFLANGLRVLDGAVHRAEFLASYGYLFSQSEVEAIKSAWASYFGGGPDSSRDGLLWFCLSPYLVVNDGTEYFFEYFGGEAVHMPLDAMPAIMSKLRAIGQAVVVEVSINPAELRTFGKFPLALNALSHYHRLVNPAAYIHSCEGYLSRKVRPDEILRVVGKNEFFAQFPMLARP